MRLLSKSVQPPRPPITPPPGSAGVEAGVSLLPTVLTTRAPPTPAASPRPESQELEFDERDGPASDWPVDERGFDGDEDAAEFMASVAARFPTLSTAARRTFLSALLPLFTTQDLLHASTVIAPLLKRDFISDLPQELALQVMANLEDPKDLTRASQVCRTWRRLVNDDQMWKIMSERHGFRMDPLRVTPHAQQQPQFTAPGASSVRLPGAETVEINGAPTPTGGAAGILAGLGLYGRTGNTPGSTTTTPAQAPAPPLPSTSASAQALQRAAGLGLGGSTVTSPIDRRNRQLPAAGRRTAEAPQTPSRHFSSNPFGIAMVPINPAVSHPAGDESPNSFSYKTHFKRAYLTESNWLRGPGRLLSTQASTEDGVVTSLGFDSEWIVVGMATSKIHVFDANTGDYVLTLDGHEQGVWCLTLVSSGGVRLGPNGKPLARSRSKAAQTNDEDRDRAWATGRQFAADAHFAMQDLDAALNASLAAGGPTSPPRQHRRAGSAVSPTNSRRAPRASMPAPESKSEEKRRQRRQSSDLPRPDDLPDLSNFVPLNADGGVTAQQASVCGTARGWGQDGAVVVSGGCDRDVRVWDVKTGICKFVLRGHSSTIRCLKVLDGRPLAVSGSRDGTLRVWDIERGQMKHLLQGHQHSVRCIEVSGNMVVSGSYDTTCRLWDVDTGECKFVFRGHFHQIYAVAFDGQRVATGSLDSTVRIWSARTGECLALLQGHTSLVGQLQLTDQVLVTGGSDGRVIVFSLANLECLHRLCAHDNSVTSIQFDNKFIITGGNDGRVKLWSYTSGQLIRELVEQCEAVWRIAFRDDKIVIIAKRAGRTVVDLYDMRSDGALPPPSSLGERSFSPDAARAV